MTQGELIAALVGALAGVVFAFVGNAVWELVKDRIIKARIRRELSKTQTTNGGMFYSRNQKVYLDVKTKNKPKGD
jgi:23S rRNA maturation mini-RNase III